MAIKTINELKEILRLHGSTVKKNSIKPTDVFNPMEDVLDTLLSLYGDGFPEVNELIRNLGYKGKADIGINVGSVGYYAINEGNIEFIQNEEFNTSTEINMYKGMIYLVRSNSLTGLTEGVSYFTDITDPSNPGLTESSITTFLTEDKGILIVPSKDMKVVVSLPEIAFSDITCTEINYQSISQLMELLNEDDFSTIRSKIDYCNGILDELRTGTGKYCVAQIRNGEASPDRIDLVGDINLASDWHYYLIDVNSDQIDGKVEPVGELQNNLFRFIDDSFAPVVAITEAQKSECDVELYLNNDGTNKYCNAGEFDPVKFYNEHRNSPLYNSSGKEVRVLKPWETTETKYIIGVGRTDTIYLVDGQVGQSGKRWRGIFNTPTANWDGIDISKFKLEPTLIPLGNVTYINNTPRFMYFDYNTNQSGCTGSKGADNLIDIWHGPTVNKTYPKISIGSQTHMVNCRKLNANPNSPVPFAEGGYLTLNAYIICQELLYGTNDLHAAGRFGSGISNNDSCNNETALFINGGLRYRVKGSDTWSYQNIDSGVCNIYNSSGTKYNMYSLLSNQYPKEECMESQMVASWIKENNIQPLSPDNNVSGSRFQTPYGGTYYYNDIPEFNGVSPKSILDGGMNARIYRVIPTITINAFNSEGVETEFELEIVERFSLYGGLKLSGDIFTAYEGGLECVGTCDVGPNTSRKGNTIDVYVQPDQSKWHNDTTISKNNLGVFDFESTYLKINSYKNPGDGYITERIPYAPDSPKVGGSLHTYDCAYSWNNNNWGALNQRVRIMHRFGGHANSSYCSPRYCHSSNSFSHAARNLGCSAQVQLRHRQ